MPADHPEGHLSVIRGADLLEKPCIEATGVVDQHVDATEPVDGRLHSLLGGGVGDVELPRSTRDADHDALFFKIE
ncbi:hypothetical protein [Nocardia sp. NBC_00881]|uniref:hypothetical protein n=1 Tax=Nocardia sp. NBC_00881 TaxID=2975995 RepID=UPI003870ADF3